MATDYDAPRRPPIEDETEPIDELTIGRADPQSAVVDLDESDTAESFELPGADLSGEELLVRVVPQREDEFTCTRCFLVQHHSQLAISADGELICRDCAG